jgi:transketolase
MVVEKLTEDRDTRSGFGAGLQELGQENKDVVALCADLTGSLKKIQIDFSKLGLQKQT